ncbi:hypothetical protein Ddye_007788 [Dipteronia dyeriana]|uniref:Exo_endo_phos domain-containing protein n=1 Tax=Dipteronia dyeriana TaxID=168575 RepID=A0AAE0CRT5_9ROSI|nr:hypothetical protein Ddye_007788 [Dipteronia dyeriana]
MKKWRVLLGYERKLVINSIGRSGGLCLFWYSSIEVNLLSYSQDHIDVKIKRDRGLWWRFTGFYGKPEHYQWKHSWTLLRRIAGMSNLPWICIGDFNEILWDNEKMGGCPKSWRKLAEFREALENCSLEDMGFAGPNFTWSNKKEGSASVLERLDRGQ